MPNRKLDREQVIEIWHRCEAGGETYTDIAADYGVHRRQASRIHHGDAYADITADLRGEPVVDPDQLELAPDDKESVAEAAAEPMTTAVITRDPQGRAVRITDERGGATYDWARDRGSYRFYLPGRDPIEVPDTQVQEWHEMYAAAGQAVGRGAKVREICRRFHINPGLFDQLKRLLCLVHDSPPFAPHRLVDGEADDLVRETMEMREDGYFDRLLEREKDVIEERYKAMLEERATDRRWADLLARQLTEPLPDPRTFVPTGPAAPDTGSDPRAVNLVLADLHTGKHVKPGAVAGPGSDGVAREQMLERRDELIAKLQRLREYHIEDAGITLLGDLLESLMADKHWGHSGEVWAMGYSQIRHAVEWLEPVFAAMLDIIPDSVPLKIVSVGGNHDRIGVDRSHDPARTGALIVVGFLRERLRAYEGAGRLVWVSPQLTDESEGRDHRPWAGLTVGTTRYLAHHGDRRSLKPARLVVLDQQDTGRAWATYTVLEGHKHDIDITQDENRLRVRVPSIIGPDSYSNGQLGYLGYSAATLFTSRPGDLFPSHELIWLGGSDRAGEIEVAA